SAIQSIVNRPINVSIECKPSRALLVGVQRHGAQNPKYVLTSHGYDVSRPAMTAAVQQQSETIASFRPRADTPPSASSASENTVLRSTRSSSTAAITNRIFTMNMTFVMSPVAFAANSSNPETALIQKPTYMTGKALRS